MSYHFKKKKRILDLLNQVIDQSQLMIYQEITQLHVEECTEYQCPQGVEAVTSYTECFHFSLVALSMPVCLEKFTIDESVYGKV